MCRHRHAAVRDPDSTHTPASAQSLADLHVHMSTTFAQQYLDDAQRAVQYPLQAFIALCRTFDDLYARARKALLDRLAQCREYQSLLEKTQTAADSAKDFVSRRASAVADDPLTPLSKGGGIAAPTPEPGARPGSGRPGSAGNSRANPKEEVCALLWASVCPTRLPRVGGPAERAHSVGEVDDVWS